MSFGDIGSPDAFLSATKECDRLGRYAFLDRYGFKPARAYHLLHGGKYYDSKAIVGVAHRYQFPAKGPLKFDEFSGGKPAKAKLERLRFKVRVKR